MSFEILIRTILIDTGWTAIFKKVKASNQKQDTFLPIVIQICFTMLSEILVFTKHGEYMMVLLLKGSFPSGTFLTGYYWYIFLRSYCFWHKCINVLGYCMYIHIYLYTCILCIHTHTHMYIRIYTHMYTHTGFLNTHHFTKLFNLRSFR